MKNKKANIFLSALLGIIYFCSSFLLANKYGITLDEPIIYNAAELHLEYLLTGKKELLDSHQNSQNKLAALNLRQHPWHKVPASGPFTHPQITPILSAISCKVFFQKLNWLNSIDAHHLPLFVISSVGISILAFFIYSETSNIFLALSSALFLGLFPRFFALSRTNPTDVGSAIAIMTATFLFYKAFKSSKKLYLLIVASFFLGVNFAVKANAVITVAAVLSWLLIERKGRLWNKNWRENEIFILSVYFIVAFFIFMSGHPYYWDMTSPIEIFTKTAELINYEKGWGLGINPNWNFSQPFVLFAVTPPIMAFTFPFGLVYFYKKYSSLFFLLFFLFFWSFIRTCLPFAKNFDGIRHYIEITIPLAVFSSAGLYFLANWLSNKYLKLIYNNLILFISFTTALLCMIFPVYKYFPYENVYFNNLVGGAKQAAYNPRLDYWSGDYWQLSSWEMVKWLNENAEKNAQVYDLVGVTHYYHDPENPESFLRRDLVFPENSTCTKELLPNITLNGTPVFKIMKSIKTENPGFIKNPDCFVGNGYMIITHLRQRYKWNALYQTLTLNGDGIIKTIEREGYPIAYIVKANVVVYYDKFTREAIHFDLNLNKFYLTTKDGRVMTWPPG